MSHVATIELEVKDLDALAKAAESLGLEFRQGKKTYRWFGRSVGDYPLPAGFKADDLGKCEHAIGIPNDAQAYEIGVVKSKTGQGFTLLWDFWNGGYGIEAKVGTSAGKLTQEYAAQVATKKLKAQGYNVQRKVAANGKLQLVAR